MYGAGKPKILEWKLLKDALSGIGLLKYYAGDFGDGQDSSLEYVAIVDTRANKVISVEPHAWGASPAQWNWQAVSVVVTDPDGNKNEVQLRKVRQRAPVARDDFWGFERRRYSAEAPTAAARRAAAAVERRAAAVAACSTGCSGDPVPRQRARRRGSRIGASRRRRHRRSEGSRRKGRSARLPPDTIAACVRHVAGPRAGQRHHRRSPSRRRQRPRRRTGDRFARRRLRQARASSPAAMRNAASSGLRATPANCASFSSCSPTPCPNSMPSRSPPGSARMA